MKYFTLRYLFTRQQMLSIAEPLRRSGASGAMHASHLDDKEFKKDYYVAVLVFSSEPLPDGKIRARAISTTVEGIQKFSLKNFRYGRFLETNDPPGWIIETLLAHLRSEDELLHKSVRATWPQPDHEHLSAFERQSPNGAGDVSDPPEFILDVQDKEPCDKCTHDMRGKTISGEENKGQENGPRLIH